MDKGYMAKAKGVTGSVYPTHDDAAAAMAATMKGDKMFTTYAVKKSGVTGLWVNDYHADLPKAWKSVKGTAVAQ